MQKYFLIFFYLSLQVQNKLIDFVNPFIGTSGHGRTFPGASLLFGIV